MFDTFPEINTSSTPIVSMLKKGYPVSGEKRPLTQVQMSCSKSVMEGVKLKGLQ